MSGDAVWMGEDAIAMLARAQSNHDRTASTHWRAMVEGFAYRDGGLSGLRGFGTYSTRTGTLRRLAHTTLQIPFRHMGRRYPESTCYDRACREVARAHGRVHDLDMLRQSLTLAHVDAHLGLDRIADPFFVIGDGFGTLTALLLRTHPGSTVILANLTQMLLVDLVYLRRALPKAPIALATDAAGLSRALEIARGGVVGVRADDQAIVAAARIGVAFNIASMHEMEPSVIAGYFDTMRRSGGDETYFYCCNRVEKLLPGGTVTRFADYPWRDDDTVLDDGPCPWHRFYYVAGWPPYRPFDGPLRHRLVRLAKGASR